MFVSKVKKKIITLKEEKAKKKTLIAAYLKKIIKMFVEIKFN